MDSFLFLGLLLAFIKVHIHWCTYFCKQHKAVENVLPHMSAHTGYLHFCAEVIRISSNFYLNFNLSKVNRAETIGKF